MSVRAHFFVGFGLQDSGGLNKKAFGQWCEKEGFSGLAREIRTDTLWLLDNNSNERQSLIEANKPQLIRKQYRALEKQERQDDYQSQYIANRNDLGFCNVFCTVEIF